MHRYQPRIHLILRPDASSANAAVTDLESEKLRTFVFPESIFTAVTAYQNQLVSHLSFPIPHSSSLFITSQLRAAPSLRFNFTPRFTRSLISPLLITSPDSRLISLTGCPFPPLPSVPTVRPPATCERRSRSSKSTVTRSQKVRTADCRSRTRLTSMSQKVSATRRASRTWSGKQWRA